MRRRWKLPLGEQTEAPVLPLSFACRLMLICWNSRNVALFRRLLTFALRLVYYPDFVLRYSLSPVSFPGGTRNAFYQSFFVSCARGLVTYLAAAGPRRTRSDRRKRSHCKTRLADQCGRPSCSRSFELRQHPPCFHPRPARR